ncbi:hypothetical protein ACP275_03G071500 [Erythranthe tilingii]
MDEEKKKMGLKRKSKPVEISVDSDDDELIGTLLKMKSKRNSKKSKLVADRGGNKVKGAEDEELGGMDDTLAIFRKKLRGPKKDGGSAIEAAKESSTSIMQPSHNESVKDQELDPNLISVGGSSGKSTVMEGLKAKGKMKNKRSRVDIDIKMIGNSVDGSRSGNNELQRIKEGNAESEGEAFEDSLSAFYQKVQSGMIWKSHGSSRLKQGKETQVSDDGLKPNSGADSEGPDGKSPPASKLIKKLLVTDDNRDVVPAGQDSIKSTSNCRSVDDSLPEGGNRTVGNPTDSDQGISSGIPDMNQIWRSNEDLGDSSREVGVEDGKINSEAIGDEPSPTNDIIDINNEVLHSVEAKDSVVSTSLCEGIAKNSADVKIDSGLDTSLDSKSCSQVQLHSSPSAFHRLQKEHPSGDPAPPCSSQEADDRVCECISPVKVVSESERVFPEGPCPKNYNPSEDEEANGSCAEEIGSIADPESKENSLTVGQRAARNAKKHRHGDMAYEGDVDWEVLMQGQEFFVSNQNVDRTREKLNSSPTALDAENGKAAAVAAGLKARAAGPLEKIKFKEVLKRKGGLQEYLECRNNILRVWNKDVRRMLSLADFGVSGAPSMGESPRTSLLRDIFTFLNHCGYINFGVPSEKEKVENFIKHDLKLFTETKFEETSGLPGADSDDPGKQKISKTSIKENNDGAFADGNLEGKTITGRELLNLEALDSSALCVPEGCLPDGGQGVHSLDTIPLKETVSSDCLVSIPSCEDVNGKTVPAVDPDVLPSDEAVCAISITLPKGSSDILSESMDCAYTPTLYDSGPRRNIIVVGAGPAGLTAARHLQRQGFNVIVLEARSRIGGRVFTDRSSLSVPVDLGASIITGVEADVATERRPDPSSLICAQLGLELTVLNSDCPLYDTVTGQKVPADLDEALESEYNSLLDDMELLVVEKGERAMKMSLEEGLEYGLRRRRMANSPLHDMGIISVKSEDTPVAVERSSMDDETSKDQVSKSEGLSPLERRVMDWHFAHLEYGCAALLQEVSLPNWNQDDVYGGFGGAHCMIKGGYSAVVESLGEGICVHFDHVVTDISYSTNDCEADSKLHKKVKVSISNGKEFSGDAVLVTVPLGCLKAESIKFSPPLPEWKYSSIKRLGFGVLNKLVLEFSEVFWDDTIDYFGATAEDRDQRGRCFMFWNVKKTVGAPVLIALVVGKAAIDGQSISSSDHVSHALLILRKLFGEKVSDPVASLVTDWGNDPYSYGAYSYVAVGSSGEDYDILGRPVNNCLFFAGEATCKEHPDTVGGAMMSGLREAVRIIDILNTGTDYTAEVEAMEAAKRHLDIERTEVKDIIRRLDAVDFSKILYKKSLDGSQISSWGSMLKDMFFTAKTTAGRLHLAKELLNLPVGVLKTIASTKEGLSTLNSWILDSMGKDGTQLLRHCVRLLVLVSNDLLAVRLSGVGKTVKEKVCVHTSRDIRAIASQLVSVWVELFRKEKASKRGLKLLRQSASLDLKSKSPPVFAKPPLCTKKVVEEPVESVNAMEEDNREIPMSEEEKAAFAAAEAARAAAIAAAKAYASSGAIRNSSLQPPKILSFHKFAMREQHAHMDEPDSRKNWSGAALGRQDCLSEIDSRNCRVRDWSVDFSATGVNLESSKMSIDNRSQRSHSNEIANQLNIREHSGESVAVDSSLLTKAWVDSAGSIGIKDYNAIERWQCQAAAASSGFSHGTMHLTDEEDSNMSSQSRKWKHEAPANESSASQVTTNKETKGNQLRGTEHIKQSVVDYVASLLMPLYKARKIDREGYKSIMKKTATKVMEQTTDSEKSMAVFEFLDYKRKNKIRAFVDMLIERHMAMKTNAKSGSSGKD